MIGANDDSTLSASIRQAAAAYAAMSASGHKQTSRDVRVTSALPPIADIRRMSRQVRYVPKADISNQSLCNAVGYHNVWTDLPDFAVQIQSIKGQPSNAA